MKYNIDTDTERYNDPDSTYANDPRFSNNQLEEIRYGIENGMDVTVYANPDIPPDIMRSIRRRLQGNHKYAVRFTKDDGLTICNYFCICHTKSSALHKFQTEAEESDGATVVDIRCVDVDSEDNLIR